MGGKALDASNKYIKYIGVKTTFHSEYNHSTKVHVAVLDIAQASSGYKKFKLSDVLCDL